MLEVMSLMGKQFMTIDRCAVKRIQIDAAQPLIVVAQRDRHWTCIDMQPCRIVVYTDTSAFNKVCANEMAAARDLTTCIVRKDFGNSRWNIRAMDSM